MTLNSVMRRIPGLLVAVAVVSSSAGCYTMARVPAGYITSEKPAQVFVRDAEGAIYSLSNPTIVHDSLVGQDGEDQMSVNLREVDAMAVRALSPTRTAGAIGAAAGVLGVVAFGVVKATSSKDCPRVANKNNMCLSDVPDCKYGACDADNGFPAP